MYENFLKVYFESCKIFLKILENEKNPGNIPEILKKSRKILKYFLVSLINLKKWPKMIKKNSFNFSQNLANLPQISITSASS